MRSNGSLWAGRGRSAPVCHFSRVRRVFDRQTPACSPSATPCLSFLLRSRCFRQTANLGAGFSTDKTASVCRKPCGGEICLPFPPRSRAFRQTDPRAPSARDPLSAVSPAFAGFSTDSGARRHAKVRRGRVGVGRLRGRAAIVSSRYLIPAPQPSAGGAAMPNDAIVLKPSKDDAGVSVYLVGEAHDG